MVPAGQRLVPLCRLAARRLRAHAEQQDRRLRVLREDLGERLRRAAAGPDALGAAVERIMNQGHAAAHQAREQRLQLEGKELRAPAHVLQAHDGLARQHRVQHRLQEQPGPRHVLDGALDIDLGAALVIDAEAVQQRRKLLDVLAAQGRQRRTEPEPRLQHRCMGVRSGQRLVRRGERCFRPAAARAAEPLPIERGKREREAEAQHERRRHGRRPQNGRRQRRRAEVSGRRGVGECRVPLGRRGAGRLLSGVGLRRVIRTLVLHEQEEADGEPSGDEQQGQSEDAEHPAQRPCDRTPVLSVYSCIYSRRVGLRPRRRRRQRGAWRRRRGLRSRFLRVQLVEQRPDLLDLVRAARKERGQRVAQLLTLRALPAAEQPLDILVLDQPDRQPARPQERQELRQWQARSHRSAGPSLLVALHPLPVVLRLEQRAKARQLGERRARKRAHIDARGGEHAHPADELCGRRLLLERDVAAELREAGNGGAAQTLRDARQDPDPGTR
jgi:hypothetical protein